MNKTRHASLVFAMKNMESGKKSKEKKKKKKSSGINGNIRLTTTSGVNFALAL